MRRNFCCNLFQRFVQIFGRSGRSLSTVNYCLCFHDFQKQCSFGGKRLESFYCSNSFFFAWKRSQIKSFLLMLHTFYFDSVFLRNCSSFLKLSESKRREVKFSFKVFSKLPSEDTFWMSSIAVQCFGFCCTNLIFFFNRFKIILHYWEK